MSFKFSRFLKLLISPGTLSGDEAGSLEVDSGTNKINYHNGVSASPIVTEAHTATLVNKTIDRGSNTLTSLAITNSDVSNSAGITYGKLSLSNSIVNADINSSAAIVYSKLSLGNSIVNADINSGAAIAYSKLSLTGSLVDADFSSGSQLAISKGGTGQSTANAAFNALAPTTTKGDVIAHNGSINVRLGVGSNGQVLTADSTQASGLIWSNSTVGNNSINEFKLTTSVAGDGLAGGNGTPLSVNVDNSTIEINADTLRVKDLGITTSKIADSNITTAKIANSNVTGAKIETGVNLPGNAVQVNGKYVVVIEDALPTKTIRGNVSSAGGILNGDGFTVNHTNTGQYVITFSSSFGGTPTIIVTCKDANLSLGTVAGPSSSSVEIDITNVGSLAFEDRAFGFIAIGPR